MKPPAEAEEEAEAGFRPFLCSSPSPCRPRHRPAQQTWFIVVDETEKQVKMTKYFLEIIVGNLYYVKGLH